MIYESVILENSKNQFNNLTNTMTIMQNYYENEISFLNSVIDYQTITESCDLKTFHEGFIENAINKIKELIDKFIEWVKNLWDKFMSLFKRKTSKADNAMKQVKDRVKKIENDNSLSKEEKEVKKQQVVDKITKSNNDESKQSANIAHDDIKLIEYKPKKYRYYYIEPTYIFNTLLLKANAATRDVINMMTRYKFYDIDSDDIDGVEALEDMNDKLDKVKSVTSLDEAWEEFTKNYYRRPTVLTPDQVIKQTEENIEDYKDLQELFEKRKKTIDERTNSLRKSVNNINKNTNDKNLSLCYSVLNKYIAINEKELAIAAQFITKLGSNLKVVECND